MVNETRCYVGWPNGIKQNLSSEAKKKMRMKREIQNCLVLGMR